jgi:pilus assembly protein CpaF
MSRLEAMILMSNPSMTAEVIRPYISAAIHLVAQTLRLSDGTRKIVSIAEVVSEDEDLKLKEIFRFVRQGVEVTGQVIGYFTATGYVPDCVHRLKTFGHELPADLFRPEEGAVSRVG